jgi:hypothetical protein
VADQEATDQVAGGEVVVAGDRHQRQLQAPSHVFDEAGLAATGRSLEHHRELPRMALLEDGDLVAGRHVERFGAAVLARLDGRRFLAAPLGKRRHQLLVAGSRG